MPAVSIVIVNYNTFDLTCQCIESILKYTKDISFEIILVDNASIETNADFFQKKYPNVILIKSPLNVGFAKGNNLGLEKAKAEFILLLNSDAFLQNNVLKLLCDFLINHRHVAAVSARLENPDGTPQHNCQRFPSVRYKLFELFRLQKFLPQSIAGKVLFGSFFDYKTTAFPDWIWGTCFMFKKEILKQLSERKLADDFFMYGEDVQWCMEFKKIDYSVAFEPSAKVIHLMGKSGGKKDELMEQNARRFMNKYYSLFHQKSILTLNRLLR